jgi:ferredoxin/flavodoxin---NADP+ reductase
LYLFATGTGLAPFMSIIRDPSSYEKFEKIVLVHSVRWQSELAYRELLTEELKQDEFLGELAAEQFIYYPTVTREDFQTTERLTALVESGKLAADCGLPPINPAVDRAMICGGPSMLADTRVILDKLGFTISPGIGEPGDYVIERAFVEK